MFGQYKRKQIAELRPITEDDIRQFEKNEKIEVNASLNIYVSISDVDSILGSPKLGDMVARNPKNHLDQWLVSADYFKDNFEEI